MDDVFIVDQHAAAEKFNFEALQGRTKIRLQRLFRFVSMFCGRTGLKSSARVARVAD